MTRGLSFRIKTTQRFLSVSSRGHDMPTLMFISLTSDMTIRYAAVSFGMVITDPEHCNLRLKWRDYHGIIAHYKTHNAKRVWFVLVFEVVMQ